MLHVLVLTGLCLLGAGLLIASQRKRYRIKHTGMLVMAKVTQVQSWRDSSRADFSLQMKMLPSSEDNGGMRFALNGPIHTPRTPILSRAA